MTKEEVSQLIREAFEDWATKAGPRFDKSEAKCHGCGELSHFKRDCSAPKNTDEVKAKKKIQETPKGVEN